MTKKLLEQMNELAKEYFEEIGYIPSILSYDFFKAGSKACHDIMSTEFEAQKAEMMADIWNLIRELDGHTRGNILVQKMGTKYGK